MNLAAIETLLTDSLEPRCSAPQRTRALHLIHENNCIPPELALCIYQNNVSGARAQSLASSYPACFRILGETCFNNIAYRLIEHTPSEQPDLNYYGATFSNFLDDWTTSHEQFSDYHYLGDLARLEWLCHTAYYEADDPPFDFRTLAETCHAAHETLHFRLGHSVGLLQSEYPVMAIRTANLWGDDASEVRAGEPTGYLVVSRPVFQPEVEQVDAATFQVLKACREGKTLGQIVDTNGGSADKIAETFPTLIQRGWITGVTAHKACTPRGR